MPDENGGEIEKHPSEIFWEAFNEARMNKSIAEYCEMSIDALKKECDGFKCLMKEIKAKMTRNSECSKYDSVTKKKPKKLSRLARFYEKLRISTQKMEESIKLKEAAAIDEARQFKDAMASERVKGWWDESTIEMKKNAYLGKRPEKERDGET